MALSTHGVAVVLLGRKSDGEKRFSAFRSPSHIAEEQRSLSFIMNTNLSHASALVAAPLERYGSIMGTLGSCFNWQNEQQQ